MGSLRELFTGLVNALIVPRLDPLALYPATVKAMNDDGTVDVKPDSPRWGAGPSRVPVRGLPGVVVKVKVGARVHLTFSEGDEARPIAVLFDADSLDTLTVVAATKILLQSPNTVLAQAEGNAKGVARGGDLVKVTGICGPPGSPLELVGYIIDASKEVSAG